MKESKERMSKPITIADIARLAGVSPSTVSRVLNGSKRVAEEKRLQVLAAVEQFQFRPNAIARGLVRGRSMLIGVLVQDIVSPFFGQLVQGIEQGLMPGEYQPMLTTTHWRSTDPDEEIRALQLLLDRQVDGLIVLAGRIPDEQLREVAKQLPLIVVTRKIAGLEQQCITIDNQQAAYRVTRYLLGLGHTRIAHIAGASDHPDAIDRLIGYRRALSDAGIPYNEGLVVPGYFTSESGLLGIEELLARGEQFSAVFASNDDTAYGVMLGLYNHGYHIPGDISVVGFDDQLHAAYTLPPLTTMRQPAIDMGRMAAEGMLRLLDGKDAQLPAITPELVIRKSAQRLRLLARATELNVDDS
jgi:LacI family transcriptional regulator